jgi:hypothetical protein
MTRSRAPRLVRETVNLRYPGEDDRGDTHGEKTQDARMRRSFWLTEEEAASATGSAADVDMQRRRR